MLVETEFIVECESEILEAVNHFNCFITGCYFFCFPDLEMKPVTHPTVWSVQWCCDSPEQNLWEEREWQSRQSIWGKWWWVRGWCSHWCTAGSARNPGWWVQMMVLCLPERLSVCRWGNCAHDGLDGGQCLVGVASGSSGAFGWYWKQSWSPKRILVKVPRKSRCWRR